LPLRSSEAAAIADLLFQSIEALANSGRQLTDDARHRLASRLKGIDTPTIRAYPLSLEPDPIHPSSYYLAVDGLQHNAVTPLLLRFGLASSPASGLFPKSVLIGRMRPAGGREVVVNAIPFGPTDREPIRTFTEKVTKDFQPRPQGGQPALIVSADDFTPAFEAFRQLDRNRASFSADFQNAEAAYFAVLWAAVRSGWRDGYSLGVTGIPANASSQAPLERLNAFTRYTVNASNLEAAAAIYDNLRRLKMRTRGFDFELDFRGIALSADSLSNLLQSWRTAGRTVHSIIPPADADVEVLSAVTRQHNALLTVEESATLRGRGHRLLHNPSIETLLEFGRD
jgi:hypothetical protein